MQEGIRSRGQALAGAVRSSHLKNIYFFFKVTQGHGNLRTCSLMIRDECGKVDFDFHIWFTVLRRLYPFEVFL